MWEERCLIWEHTLTLTSPIWYSHRCVHQYFTKYLFFLPNPIPFLKWSQPPHPFPLLLSLFIPSLSHFTLLQLAPRPHSRWWSSLLLWRIHYPWQRSWSLSSQWTHCIQWYWSALPFPGQWCRQERLWLSQEAHAFVDAASCFGPNFLQLLILNITIDCFCSAVFMLSSFRITFLSSFWKDIFFLSWWEKWLTDEYILSSKRFYLLVGSCYAR